MLPREPERHRDGQFHRDVDQAGPGIGRQPPVRLADFQLGRPGGNQGGFGNRLDRHDCAGHERRREYGTAGRRGRGFRCQCRGRGADQRHRAGHDLRSDRGHGDGDHQCGRHAERQRELHTANRGRRFHPDQQRRHRPGDRLVQEPGRRETGHAQRRHALHHLHRRRRQRRGLDPTAEHQGNRQSRHVCTDGRRHGFPGGDQWKQNDLLAVAPANRDRRSRRRRLADRRVLRHLTRPDPRGWRDFRGRHPDSRHDPADAGDHVRRAECGRRPGDPWEAASNK